MNKYGQVYKITNKINNKIYIGITIHDDVIKDRYAGNLLNTHNNHLKFSILKYGVDNFVIETIYLADSRDELEDKEKEYIAFYNSINTKYGYNQHIGGIGGRMSDEINVIIGQKSKELWDSSPERKINLIEKNKNNPIIHTLKSKQKISESRKEKIANGEIDLSKQLYLLQHDKNIIRKRVISNSKIWYIQYDLDFNELNKWHTLKDMYDYVIENNIDEKITYGGFKNKYKQDIVFNSLPYKEFYWRKINKLQYADTEVSLRK